MDSSVCRKYYFSFISIVCLGAREVKQGWIWEPIENMKNQSLILKGRFNVS